MRIQMHIHKYIHIYLHIYVYSERQTTCVMVLPFFKALCGGISRKALYRNTETHLNYKKFNWSDKSMLITK